MCLLVNDYTACGLVGPTVLELTATSSTFAHYHISGNIVNRINLDFLILALLSAFINSFNLTVLAEGFLAGPYWRVKPTNIQRHAVGTPSAF